MKKIWLLTKVQLRTALDLKIGNKKIQTDSFFYMISGLFGLFIMLLSFVYSYMIGFALNMAGALSYLPVLVMAIISFITLMTSIYKVQGILFGFKDYDLIMALPVKTSYVVISRFLLLYIVNLAITFFVIVPSNIAYGILAKTTFLFYIVSFFMIFIIPLIPMVISYLLGLVIGLISQRFKYKNIISLIFSIGLIVLIVSSSFFLSNESNIKKLEDMFSHGISRIYFLAEWYRLGVVELQWEYILLFTGVSLIVFGVFTYIVGKNFKKINTLMSSVYTKKNYKLKAMRQGSPIGALYKKEIKRYFASSLYVMNTAVGVVMLTIGTIALLFVKEDTLMVILEMPDMAGQLRNILPLAISFMVALTYTTGCSISLEGCHLWILKASPVSEKEIFLSKILVNLTVTIPAILFNGIVLIFALKLNVIEGIMVFFVPTMYALFSAISGLIVNLFLPNLNWTSEVTVIKQSPTSLVSALMGFATTGLPFALLMVAGPKYSVYVNGVVGIVIGILAFVAWQYLIKSGSRRFKKLGA